MTCYSEGYIREKILSNNDELHYLMRKYANKIQRKINLLTVDCQPRGLIYSIQYGEEYHKYGGEWRPITKDYKHYDMFSPIFKVDPHQYPYVALDYQYKRERLRKNGWYGSSWEEYTVSVADVKKVLSEAISDSMNIIVHENLSYHHGKIFKVIIPLNEIN